MARVRGNTITTQYKTKSGKPVVHTIRNEKAERAKYKAPKRTRGPNKGPTKPRVCRTFSCPYNKVSDGKGPPTKTHPKGKPLYRKCKLCVGGKEACHHHIKQVQAMNARKVPKLNRVLRNLDVHLRDGPLRSHLGI